MTAAVEGATAAAVVRRAKNAFIDSYAPVLTSRQCSWCTTSESESESGQVLATMPPTHKRESARAIGGGRELYRCDRCGGRTVACATYGCRRMAQGGVLGSWTDGRFCRWCAMAGEGERQAMTLFAATADVYKTRG